MQHMPSEEVRLVGERRASGEQKYYLANLPADANLRSLAAAIKARWVCEQAHQQLKEEFGLDHFEGRSLRGLHRHALMTMIAYACLQHRRLRERGKRESRPARLNRRCQPYEKQLPSPPFWRTRRLADVHIAEDESAGHSDETTKVALGIFRTYPPSMDAAILSSR